MLGSSGAGLPPLSLRAPDPAVGRGGREPTRKVQLAVRAEDRAVTKAVLRVGESREKKEGGAWAWPPGAPGEEGPAPGPGSCGHGLQVALQLTHGSLVQGEEIKVEGGVGDVEVAGLLNQVHDLEDGAGQVAGLGLGWPSPLTPPAVRL